MNKPSKFRQDIENILRQHGTPLQRRDSYWVWNDQYPYGLRRLKWWGIRIKPEALRAVKRYCRSVPGVKRVYLNTGQGRDLCILVDRPVRELV